jgi:hypothetical protein
MSKIQKYPVLNISYDRAILSIPIIHNTQWQEDYSDNGQNPTLIPLEMRENQYEKMIKQGNY